MGTKGGAVSMRGVSCLWGVVLVGCLLATAASFSVDQGADSVAVLSDTLVEVSELDEISSEELKKKKDCAEGLNCPDRKAKGKKGKMSQNQKAKAGLFGRRKINVKQIDTERKKMDKRAASMKEKYHKLLSGKEAKKNGKHKGKIAKKAQEVYAKSRKRKSARESARKKMAASKTKSKEKFKKSNLKVKEKMEKKRLSKLANAKERATKKAKAPKTAEGWITRAAQHRFDAYKKHLAAAKVAKLYAMNKASKSQVAKADKAARLALVAFKKSEAQAVKAHQEKLQKKKKKKKQHKAKGKAQSSKGRSGSKPGKKVHAKKTPLAKKVKNKKSNSLCSKEGCKKKCKTSLCFRYCMRCMKIKTERLAYDPRSGLVNVAASTEHVLNPASRARWVDSAMRRLRRQEKQHKDAEKFAVDEFKQVHCMHCKRMCEDEPNYNKQQKMQCIAACTSCGPKKKTMGGHGGHHTGRHHSNAYSSGRFGPHHWECKRCNAKCKSDSCHKWCSIKFCGGAQVKKASAKYTSKPSTQAMTYSSGGASYASAAPTKEVSSHLDGADNPLSPHAMKVAAQKGQHVHIITLPTVVVERHQAPPIPKATGKSPADVVKEKIARRATAMMRAGSHGSH